MESTLGARAHSDGLQQENYHNRISKTQAPYAHRSNIVRDVLEGAGGSEWCATSTMGAGFMLCMLFCILEAVEVEFCLFATFSSQI
jgi:hypothetical protein